jgi:hypothetical protein
MPSAQLRNQKGSKGLNGRGTLIEEKKKMVEAHSHI